MAAIYSHFLLLLLFLLLASASRDVTGNEESSSFVLEYSVTEEQTPGSLIAHLPSNSKVAAHLFRTSQVAFHVLGESILSRYLHLDSYTGNLSVHDVIDRDVICPGQSKCPNELQIAIYASDNFVVFKVIISLEDINDNPPKFSEQKYHVIIPEDASPGERFALPSAVDADSPSNGIAEYRLPSAPANFRLEIDEFTLGDEDTKRPFLVLTRELDREIRDRFFLSLVCYDSGKPRLSGSTIIEVEVGDVNDNNPVFERSTYDVIVPEDAPIGMTVMRVKAVDADAGLNGKVRYSLSQKSLTNYGETFVIDEERGDVVLLQNLDHSRQPSFNISVIARDRSESPVPVMATLFIVVDDVNDHPPQVTIDFLTESGKMELAENQLPGVFVGHVSVSDADDGLNKEVVCAMDGDELKLVSIYPGEFKLVSNKIFDREAVDRYEIILRCHDLGTPPLWSNKTLTLHILDLNDNPPLFERHHYEVSVPESLRLGSFVLKVSASDEDTGDHGQIFYSILPTNKSEEDVTQMFHIDPESGTITTIAELDRERVQVYEFNVVADNFDSKLRTPKKGSMSSKAFVRLLVTDVDDNGPRFIHRNFTFLVSENLPARSIVGTLVARDADAPPNDAFAFRPLMTGDGMGEVFSVDPKTGVISTWKTLDREIKEFYSMRVEVFSTSDSSKNDTANVFIRVEDRNDNAPIFIFPSVNDNNNLNIFLNHPIGAEVVAFAANDADVGDNADLTYEMVAGNATDYFRLDRKTGSLQLSRAFHVDDVNKTFSVVVRVKDSGQQEQLDSLTTVTFTVLDSHSMPLQSGIQGFWQLMSDSSFIVIASFLGLVILCIVFVVAFITVITRKLKENRKLDTNEQFDAKMTLEDPQFSSSLLASDTSLRATRHTTDHMTLSGIPDILDSELRIERLRVDDDEYLTPTPALTAATCQQQSVNHSTAVRALSRQDERRGHDPNDLQVTESHHYDADSGCYAMNELNHNRSNHIYSGGAITDILNARKMTSQGQLPPQCRHHDVPFHPLSKPYHYPLHPSSIHFNHLPMAGPPPVVDMTSAEEFAPSSAAELLTSSLLRQKNVRFSRDMPMNFPTGYAYGSLRNNPNSSVVPSQNPINPHVLETAPNSQSKSDSLRRPSPATHQYLPVKDLKTLGIEDSSPV